MSVYGVAGLFVLISTNDAGKGADFQQWVPDGCGGPYLHRRLHGFDLRGLLDSLAQKRRGISRSITVLFISQSFFQCALVGGQGTDIFR